MDDWYAGWLEITLKSGVKERFDMINLKRAQEIVEQRDKDIESALYHPSATSLK